MCCAKRPMDTGVATSEHAAGSGMAPEARECRHDAMSAFMMMYAASGCGSSSRMLSVLSFILNLSVLDSRSSGLSRPPDRGAHVSHKPRPTS